MIKHLRVDDASPQVKDFLRQLDVERDEYVLEIGGKPVAGVVPPWQVKKLSQRREEILVLLHRSWERNRAAPEEEVDRAVTEAIQEVLQEKTQTQ